MADPIDLLRTLPTLPVPPGPSPDDLRRRAAQHFRRRRRAVAGGIAVVVVAVGLGAAAALPDRGDGGHRVDTGPAGTVSTTSTTEAAPAGGGSGGASLAPAGALTPGQRVTISPDAAIPAGATVLVAQCRADVLEADRYAAVDLCTAVGYPTGPPYTLEVVRAWRDANGERIDCSEAGSCVAVLRVGGPESSDDRSAPLTFRSDIVPLGTVGASIDPAPSPAGHVDAGRIDVHLTGLQPQEVVALQQCAPEVEVGGQPCDALNQVDLRADGGGRADGSIVLYHDLYVGYRGPTWTPCAPCELRVQPGASTEAVLPLTMAPTATPSRPVLRIDPPGPLAPGQVVTVTGTGIRGTGKVGLRWCAAGRDPEMELACDGPVTDATAPTPAADGTLRVEGLVVPDDVVVAGTRCADAAGTCTLAWQPQAGFALAATVPLDLTG